MNYKAPVYPVIEKKPKIDIFNSSIDSNATSNITGITNPTTLNKTISTGNSIEAEGTANSSATEPTTNSTETETQSAIQLNKNKKKEDKKKPFTSD